MKRKISWKDNVIYFLRYYWVFALGGLLILAVLTGWLIGLIRKEPEPDYVIALMTRDTMSDQACRQLENSFAELADDRNADGRIWVQIAEFGFASAPPDGTERDEKNLGAAYENVAYTVWFKAEEQEGTCVIYLLQQPTYDALMDADPTFFLPLSACLPGVEADKLHLTDYLDLGAQWDPYWITVRNPDSAGFKGQEAYHMDSVALLQAFLRQYQSE